MTSCRRPVADLREVDEVLERLQRAGSGLRARPLGEIVTALGRVGARFLDKDDPVRRRALTGLPDEARISPPMAQAVLDGMAADWSEARLRALVSAEFEEPAVLDGWVARVGPGAEASRPRATRRLRAFGPTLCVQIVSGSVPGVAVHALLRGLLVKAPTLLKPGKGDALLAGLFAEALAEEDPGLADALAVVYWPGGSEEVERRVLQAAEVAVIYGGDETVEALRALAPATTRVVAYHHRVGVGVVGRGALGVGVGEATAAEVARAVALFEQRGCVCPQVVFVEEGGAVTPADFAREVAAALDALEADLPSAPQEAEESAGVAQLRGTLELQEAAGRSEVHHGGGEAPWTVAFEVEPLALPTGGPRTVRVRPVPDLSEVQSMLTPLGPHLQSVGYAGLGKELEEVAGVLGRVGASRIVPFRALSFPPPWWLHDGRGPLTELVRWTEVEEE